LDKKGIPSQFIVSNNLRNPPMGVLSNLLKTMNAKVGLEIYKVSIPQFAKTMIVGVDVVPSGNLKLVGCCASINTNFTKFFNKMYNHKDPSPPEEDAKY
jgi:argonaute-like protein implicated in RNA metabolism and viral defense